MADYKQTPNYGLPLYVQGDPADMRNQYNHAMNMVDGKFLGQDETIADVRKKVSDMDAKKADKGESYSKADSDAKYETQSAAATAHDDLTGKIDQAGKDSDGKIDALKTEESQARETLKNDLRKNIYSAANSGVGVMDLIPRGSDGHFLYVAHRCGTGFPEQSLKGAEWSWEHGFAPECDVRLLKDGTPVLCHDDTIGRSMIPMTGMDGSARVADTMAWQWLGMKTRPRIEGGLTESGPTLRRYLEASAGRPSVIECKQLDQQTMDKICDMVDLYGCKDSVWIICFDEGLSMSAAKRGFHVQALYGRIPSEDEMRDMRTAGVEWISLENGQLSASTVQYCHDRGFKVMAWTIDTAARAQELQGMGVDGITSNRCDYITPNRADGGNVIEPGCRSFRTNWADDRREHFGGDGLRVNGNSFYHHGNRKDKYLVINPYMYCANAYWGGLWVHEPSGFLPQIHVKGVSGRQELPDGATQLDAKRSFIRFGIYSKGYSDDLWVDPAGNPDIPANTGQNFAEIVCRQNGQVDGFCYTTGQTHGEQGPKLPDFAPDEQIAYDLYVTFGQQSLTVRGVIQGHSYNQRISYGNLSLPFEDRAQYSPFLAFDDNRIGDTCTMEISYLCGSTNN